MLFQQSISSLLAKKVKHHVFITSKNVHSEEFEVMIYYISETNAATVTIDTEKCRGTRRKIWTGKGCRSRIKTITIRFSGWKTRQI